MYKAGTVTIMHEAERSKGSWHRHYKYSIQIVMFLIQLALSQSLHNLCIISSSLLQGITLRAKRMGEGMWKELPFVLFRS